MRILNNCLGVISTTPSYSLHTCFAFNCSSSTVSR